MNWLQTHGPVLPVLLPAATAIVLLLLGDGSGSHPDARRLAWGRRLALGSALLGGLLALLLMRQADSGALTVYRLGGWPAPFGIVLVLDRLAAAMTLLTAVLCFVSLLYASSGFDERGLHFHPLFQLQIFGLTGAFLTGDLFNLFVFFEVMLLASYTLLAHGGGLARTRAGISYVPLPPPHFLFSALSFPLMWQTCDSVVLSARSCLHGLVIVVVIAQGALNRLANGFQSREMNDAMNRIFTKYPAPVSYTHLTLPTNREV